MLLLGFSPTLMSIYGSDFTGIYVSTFLKMVQKECKWKLNLRRLYAAYIHDLVMSKNTVLLRQAPPFSHWQQPLLEICIVLLCFIYPKTFLVLNTTEPFTECPWGFDSIMVPVLTLGTLSQSLVSRKALKPTRMHIGHRCLQNLALSTHTHRFQPNSSQNIFSSPVNYMATWLLGSHWK